MNPKPKVKPVKSEIIKVSKEIITAEKKRTIMSLNRLPPEAFDTPTYGYLLGKVEVLEWIERRCPEED